MVVTGNHMQLRIPCVLSLQWKEFDLVHRKVKLMLVLFISTNDRFMVTKLLSHRFRTRVFVDQKTSLTAACSVGYKTVIPSTLVQYLSYYPRPRTWEILWDITIT